MPPTITTDSGAIAVPMSTILDALEGVLTDAEREALMGQIIGLRPAGVAPGDLIEAELFNKVMSDINDLLLRVAALEGASDMTPKTPVITQIVPQLVRTGTEFTAIGENLNPLLLSRIEVENTIVPLDRIKPGSSPTRLVLDAPAIIGLPAGGATVILSVSNPAGTGQGSYVQLPGIAAEIQANVTFTLKSVTPNEAIKASTAYDYSFEIEIHSSHDETFTLAAQISGTGWTAKVKDSDKITVTSASATDGFKTTKVITVTTGATGSGTLTLSITGTNFPTFNASSQPTVVTIAAAQNIPTDKIKFNNIVAIGPNAKFANNTLFIKRQPSVAPGKIIMSVATQFVDAGTYQVSAPTAAPASDWTATRSSPDTITTSVANSSSNITINVTPKNNGAQFTAVDGQLDFLVSASGGGGQPQLPFTAQLRVVDTLP
jgi:hypothetical protein